VNFGTRTCCIGYTIVHTRSRCSQIRKFRFGIDTSSFCNCLTRKSDVNSNKRESFFEQNELNHNTGLYDTEPKRGVGHRILLFHRKSYKCHFFTLISVFLLRDTRFSDVKHEQVCTFDARKSGYCRQADVVQNARSTRWAFPSDAHDRQVDLLWFRSSQLLKVCSVMSSRQNQRNSITRFLSSRCA